MFIHSIKTTWRNIRKNKGFSMLNIAGLTLGITCFMLLGAYILHEYSYDKFFADSDRIVYVSYGYKGSEDGQFNQTFVTPTAVAPTLKAQFSEVAYTARIYRYNSEGLVDNEGQQIKENKLYYADRDLLSILTYSVLQGTKEHALSAPYQIVLTADMAKKYFPEGPAVGKDLLIDKQPWKVTAVIENPPSYSEIRFDALLSNPHLARYKEATWGSANDMTVIRLKPFTEPAALESKVNQYLEKEYASSFADGFQFRVYMDKLADLHLHKTLGTGNRLYIYIFSILAISIIGIACVNFTNLALAQVSEKGKEIAMKKLLGASRIRLLMQYLFDSFILVFIAEVIAIVLTVALLPIFSQYIGTDIQLKLGYSPLFYVALVLLAIIIAAIAGGWPALLLTGLEPKTTLKGGFLGKVKGSGLGKSLIVIQFCITTVFILCTLIIGRQMSYIQQLNTGLNRSQVLVVDGDILQDNEIPTLKEQLLRLNSVAGVTASYDSPVNIQGGYSINYAEGKMENFKLHVTAIPIEKDFISVFDIPVIAGRNLSDADILQARDTTDAQVYGFIINEKAANSLGWKPNDAIGKRIALNGRSGFIKTVVKDFNFASLKDEIKPIVLFPEYSYFGQVFVRLNDKTTVQEGINSVEKVWKTMKPLVPFDYHFLDDDYAALYKAEEQASKTMRLFSILSISIACMGLFALSAFQARQRIKEIGIRKVLGASVPDLVLMLSADFLKIVAMALLLALPLGWWIMHNWLQNFAFHTTLEWWIFLLAAFLAFLITFITVSFQAVKTAGVNPINSLRDE